MRRTRTRAEYARRIKKSLDYIHDHLDQNLSLAGIAAAAHFSPYHFHRIFRDIVGETVNDYVLRRKMERAACDLVGRPDLSITAVAEAGGFSSVANFSRSFRSYFGVSPSQFRNPHHKHPSKIGKVYRKYGKAFHNEELYSQRLADLRESDLHELDEIPMNLTVKKMPEKKIVYLTAPKGYELNSIFSTWDRIIDWARTRGIDIETSMRFGICHDHPAITPLDMCRYDASIEVTGDVDVNLPFGESRIPAGRYAVARYRGGSENISRFYRDLYAHWLTRGGFRPAHFPPLTHYRKGPGGSSDIEMDVYVKLTE